MNKWSELTEALSQLPVFDSVNATKKQLDHIRPLPQEVEGRVMQKLRLEWNYHSNAIEGNKLTYGETYSFLMYGLTAKGKPFKDHLDIKGHNEAINFLTSLVKDERDLTEGDVRDLHKMILVEPYQSAAQTPDGKETTKTIRIGEYKQQPNHVKTLTGEIHYYATPEDVPIKMHELMQWYNEARHHKKIHPSVLAAFVHHRFVAIHPFDDGNGRLARILMNLILMKNGYPPAIIKLKERTDYYAALNQADKNEYVPIIEFVAEAVSESMNLYLKAAKGGNIEEDADLDKEITLFKGSFEKTYKFRNKQVTKDVYQNVFLNIVKIAETMLNNFDDLFTKKQISLYYNKNIYSIYIKGVVEEIVDTYDKEINIEQIYDIIENEEFNGLNYNIYWNGFNKSTEQIGFNTALRIDFNRIDYQIKIKEETLLSKQYDNNVTDLEKQEVANKWVRQAFDDLKKKIEEANTK